MTSMGSGRLAGGNEARLHGFVVDVAFDICEQPIENGCNLLLDRLRTLGQTVATDGNPVCLISGGEFSCPVKGDGVGGRNLETVLRSAMQFESRKLEAELPQWVVLSAGTDGLDGNSAATGAIADQTTIARARSLGLDAHDFLERSDSFSFFDRLGDAIVTGATGTNVRDLRLLLAKPS